MADDVQAPIPKVGQIVRFTCLNDEIHEYLVLGKVVKAHIPKDQRTTPAFDVILKFCGGASLLNSEELWWFTDNADDMMVGKGKGTLSCSWPKIVRDIH